MKTNYHTHSTFCDGKETAEEMASYAFKKGFNILGFSGHSMFPFASEWHIPLNEFKNYTNEIIRLKKIYEGKMQILLGFEADYISGLSIPSISSYSQFNPDYLIGSVHYVINEQGFFEADGSIESITKAIKTYYKGNAKQAVCNYFSLQREMLKKGNFLFWGHPDLIRKNNSKGHFFNENETWYINELKLCAKEAKKAGVIAEINTGAISRGYMNDFYPSQNFLDILLAEKVPVTLASDAHRGKDLDCAFDQAVIFAKTTGYKEIMFLDAGTIKFQSI